MWPRKTKFSPVEKELRKIEREEEKMLQSAKKERFSSEWKAKLESKVPEKTFLGLQKAFSKAFSIIFEKGTALIEKTYDKDSVMKDFQIHDYAMDVRGGRKEIRRIRSGADKSNALNTVLTTAEGIGLGVLGIGLPDIVIWTAVLLRGIYETALRYGFDYDSPDEKLLILKMIEAAMQSGDERADSDAEINRLIALGAQTSPNENQLKDQIERTASAFATEMLVAKFIQGIPIVGVIGGATNPVYYHRIMSYVRLKYRKRYLMGK